MIDIDIALLRTALLEDHRLVLRRAYQLGFCTKHETFRVAHDPYDPVRAESCAKPGCLRVLYTSTESTSAAEVKRNINQTSHDNQTRIHPGKLVRAKWNNQIKNLQSSTRLFLLSTMISTPEQAAIGGGSVGAWIGLLHTGVL
jgi:hypothetical protein